MSNLKSEPIVHFAGDVFVNAEDSHSLVIGSALSEQHTVSVFIAKTGPSTGIYSAICMVDHLPVVGREFLDLIPAIRFAVGVVGAIGSLGPEIPHDQTHYLEVIYRVEDTVRKTER